MNGKLVPWDDARIPLGSHVIHYGSAVFEGIRCYKTPKGSAVFRLDAHTERLFNSAKIYWMDLGYSPAQVNEAILETIRANRKDACYIRPIAYRGAGELGVNPLSSPVELAIMVWDWGKYLGQEALEQGVDVCVSSWTRMAPNTLPAMAKSAGNYLNSQLIKVEAVKGGFAEGIALDAAGLRLRGQRREPVRGREGPPGDAAARLVDPAGHHARQRAGPGAEARDHGRGEGAAARDAVPRGRAVLHGHRGRDHADPLRGPPDASAPASVDR